MCNLPILVDTGSAVNFSEFGVIEVGDFVNNGANSKVHKCSLVDYAVKIHRPKKKQNGELNLAFTSELQFDVAHELICKPLASSIVDLRENRASLVILMPQLFNYEILSDFLKSANPTIADKITIVKQLLEGLNAIHGQEWLHGDLSERNIMIQRETLEIRFIDFEWSERCEQIECSDDEVKGTLEMVPPEVRHFGMKALSKEGEIWSVCKIILEVIDSSIREQFNVIEDCGFNNHLLEIGLERPMYKLDSKYPQIQGFVQLVEKGTCGGSNLRPSIDELLKKLKSIEIKTIGDDSFFVEAGSGDNHNLDYNSIGLEIVLNKKKRCMVRKGKRKQFRLGDNITLQINYETMLPNIKANVFEKKHQIPLTLGTKFGIGENINTITSINNL